MSLQICAPVSVIRNEKPNNSNNTCPYKTAKVRHLPQQIQSLSAQPPLPNVKHAVVIVDVRIEPAPAKPEDGATDAPVAAASVEEAPAGAAETESTQYKREPVILVLKRLFPPDGLRPKGRSVKWVTSSLNKLPEFKDNPVSEDMVYRAFKDMEAALEK